MAGVVVGMETDEITIKDPKEDLATDGEDPNNRRFVVSIFSLSTAYWRVNRGWGDGLRTCRSRLRGKACEGKNQS